MFESQQRDRRQIIVAGFLILSNTSEDIRGGFTVSRLDSVVRKIAALKERQKDLIAADARRAKQEKARFRDELAAAVTEEVESGRILTLSCREDLNRLVEGRRKRRQERA